jgi:hypothetical protein
MDRKSLAEQLAFWLTQQRIQDRARTAARKDAERWMKRMQLARRENQPELMASAVAQAEQARDQFQLANTRYNEATAEAAALRNTPPTDNAAFAAAIERSQHAMQEFEKLGLVEFGTSARLAVDAEFMLNKGAAPGGPDFIAPGTPATDASEASVPVTAPFQRVPGTTDDAIDDDLLAMADAILAADESRAVRDELDPDEEP